jgi:hypothetical protein
MDLSLLARRADLAHYLYQFSLASGLALGFGLCLLLLLTLSGGIHVGPDSLTYVRSAMQLFSADHASASAQFPPLYPAMLALLTSFGMTWTTAAKCLGVVCFVGSLILTDRILLQAGQRQPGLRLLTALVVAGSYPAWLMYTRMMTEPLFFLLTLMLIYALQRYSARTSAVGFLWLAALCACAAALTRYAGALFIPATVAVLLWHDLHSGPRRVLRRLAIVSCATLPFVFWLLRNALLHGSATGREGGDIIRQAVGWWHYPDILSQLWLPSMIPAAGRVTFALLFIVGTCWLGWRLMRGRFSTGEWRVRQTLILLMLLFLVQVALFAYGYQVDAFLPFERRLLTPMFSLFLLIHCLLLLKVSTAPDKQALLAVYFVGLIAISAVRLLATEFKVDPYRYGFDSPMWRESALVGFWQSHRDQARVVSNGDDVLWFHTGGEVLQLPKTIDPRTGRANPEFAARLADLGCQASADQPLYLIYFDTIDWRDYLPDLPFLQSAFELTLIESTLDGAVYRIRSESCRDQATPAGAA